MLRTRILTAVVLGVIVAIAVFWLDTRLASLVFGAFWLIGASEWARLCGLERRAIFVYTALFALMLILVIAFGAPAALFLAVLGLAALGWLVAFVLVLRYPLPLPRTAMASFGLIALLAAWLSFYRVHGQAGNGPGLILAGLVIIWSADIGAYFVGRTAGRTPLAPRVSPKKTWEGVGGGVILAAVAGVLAARWLDLPLSLLAPTAAAMALISVVGDLGVSMLKRSAGLKDSGVLLPGHGGIMDRFDGVTAALPFFALGLQFAHVLD